MADPPEPTNLPTISHIAGPHHTQRWRMTGPTWSVGALIDEWDLERIQVPVEDADKPLPVWPVGGWVRITGTNPRMCEALEPDKDTNEEGQFITPEDSCARVHNAITGSESISDLDRPMILEEFFVIHANGWPGGYAPVPNTRAQSEAFVREHGGTLRRRLVSAWEDAEDS